MIANHYGCRTVMRIDEAYREGIYRKYADQVDEIIYPERLGAIGAKNALLGGTIRAIADIAPHLQVVELTITDAAPSTATRSANCNCPRTRPSSPSASAIRRSGSPTRTSRSTTATDSSSSRTSTS